MSTGENLNNRRFFNRSQKLVVQYAPVILVVGFVTITGVILLSGGNATTPYISQEAEAGTLSGPAQAVLDQSASSAKAVRFGGTQTTCISAANTPDGPDPWGGCWPGPTTSGVPTAMQLVNADTGTVNPPNVALPSDNTGWAYSKTDGYISVYSQNAVIDGITDIDGIYVAASGSLTIKNSKIGTINDEGTSLLVENTTSDGGGDLQYSNVEGGTNITVLNSNFYNAEHGVHCYGNCDVENTYLHDNANGASVGTHQNGFLSNGGSTYTLKHNTVGCVGGCTADIAFLNNDVQADANVTNNLLLYAPDAAFCAYPGPNASPIANPVTNMVWENNVFQKGANGKCATYGPVYGWYPSVGTGNVWLNNVWDDGTTLNP